MTEPDPIYEEGDDLGAKESWLAGDWVLFDNGGIFVPTLGMPTPLLVHVEPTMATSTTTSHKEAIQIEHIPAEDIEPVEGLQRSRRPPTHAPDYGIVDGMYFVYTSHLHELLILCI